MPFKRTATYFLLFFFGGLSLFLLFFINIPSILESQIQKNLPEFLKPGGLDFSIQNIGVSNAFVSKIRVFESIGIDSISIDYQLKSLKRIEVKKVTISGLTLEANLDEKNHIHIQGLSFPESSRPEGENNGWPFLQFLPEKFVFQNSMIILKAFNEYILIPFEILSTQRLEDKKILVQTQLHPFGETIIIHLTCDLQQGIEFVRVEGKSFDLDHLGPHIPTEMKDIKLSGAVDFKLESLSPKKEWNLYISKLRPINSFDMAFEEINAGIVIDRHIITAGGTFRMAHPLLAENEINYDLKINTGKGLSSDFFIKTGPVSAKSDAMAASFPDVVISGNISNDENNIPITRLLIKSSKGKIQSDRNKILASDVSFEIPISYPYSKEKPMGKFSIPSVTYNNQYMFTTNGDILQTDTRKLRIRGKVSSEIFADVHTQFNTIFDLTDNQLKTHMQLNITDSTIRFPELDLTAKGINTRIDFNDLLVPETVPGQIVTIQSIDVKKIRISEAKIQFSFEDAKTLLIENIRFKWCNGLISTESFRFPQGKNEYHLTLFCDRLELTELLKQMGVFHAEGDGTLSGRIPIVYTDGKIDFNNGFLFSTPGSKGKIVIKNTDRIIAGIPMDSPEFSQLDVAREALRDFNYEWAKLTLNTQGDTLAVNMELDGKPAGLLPFEYKKEFGGFVRVDAASPGSHFQGIKLDVNLKLPFNDVMKFGNQLNTILN